VNVEGNEKADKLAEKDRLIHPHNDTASKTESPVGRKGSMTHIGFSRNVVRDRVTTVQPDVGFNL